MPRPIHSDLQQSYNIMAELLPDPALMFLNHGFHDPGSASNNGTAHVPNKYHIELLRRVLKDFDPAGKDILEIGSGRGGNCRYLRQYCSPRSVRGLDLCIANLQFCRDHHSSQGIDFLCGDSERLPFAAGAFDAVLNIESSHCYPDFEHFLSEVHRVLRPGGWFFWADLWDLAYLEADWAQREKVFLHSPLETVRDEDISEGVFCALKQEDGITGILRSLHNPANDVMVSRMLELCSALASTLASGCCSYRVRSMRKPSHEVV